jgi:Flp pilus assembly protein TadG
MSAWRSREPRGVESGKIILTFLPIHHEAAGRRRKSAMARRRKFRSGERGQVLILFALSLVILLLFVGLAIDFGLAYVTKANLGKAVDAAVLTAAKNTGLGQAGFTPVATSAFFMNYGNTNRDAALSPVVTVCGNSCNSGTICATGPPGPGTACKTDNLGNTLLDIQATSKIKTYLIGMVPAFKTVSVAATAEARYARVEMTLVIDRTGSMKNNAPPPALENAVTTFVDDFDNVNDSVAMVSFANDQKVDVPFNAVANPGVTGNFQAPIIAAIRGIDNGTVDAGFRGATFSDGALNLAKTEEAINLGLSPNTNVVHVVVFFTDGSANTVQDSLNCTGGSSLNKGAAGPWTWNFGGYDDGSTVGFISTHNLYYGTATHCADYNGRVPPDVYYDLNNNPYDDCDNQSGGTGACNSTFNSHVAGKQMPLTWTNVNQDALFRAVADADAMRATVPRPTIVYAVGLHGGSGVLDDLFLCKIANDPGAFCAGKGFVFNPNTPQGVYAPATDFSQLTAAFQQIASNIRLRLLQ